MELGAKIKRLRLQCGLTQEELADRCELTKGYISQLENELTSPSIQTLLDVLSALGTTAAEFFADEAEWQVVFTSEAFFEQDAERLPALFQPFARRLVQRHARKGEQEAPLLPLFFAPLVEGGLEALVLDGRLQFRRRLADL